MEKFINGLNMQIKKSCIPSIAAECNKIILKNGSKILCFEIKKRKFSHRNSSIIIIKKQKKNILNESQWSVINFSLPLVFFSIKHTWVWLIPTSSINVVTVDDCKMVMQIVQ